MPRFTALISDLDGTLVDTEPLHADAWLAILADFDLSFDHQWFEQWIGTSDRFVAESVIEQHQLTVVPRTLQDLKQSAYHEMAKQNELIFPGLRPILARLHRQYPTAIATNSGRADADVVFAATGLPDFFKFSVTADDVPRMKPAPDMYLLAAERLGIDPVEAIVCEDSPAGIAGAKAAGCFVIGITTSRPKDQLEEADEIVSDPLTAFNRVTDLLGSQ